jgi:hypothetical protein
MEAFEHVARVFLETQGYAVSTNVKFPVRRRTKKRAYEEYQEHGYEVDLVAARADELLLGSVKSYFGSFGLSRQFFRELSDESKKKWWESNKLFNEPEVQAGVLSGAAERFSYPSASIFLGLFVGKFKPGDEADIRAHLGQLRFGGGAVRLFDLPTIMRGVMTETKRKTYRDDPVIVALKCLDELGWIAPTVPQEHTPGN